MAREIVVVGGGGAGLVAALSASELGVRVVVLEASAECTGNTARSTGMIPAAGTSWQREAGIEDSAELMFSDIQGKNGGDCNPELAQALCARSAEAVEWLERYCSKCQGKRDPA